MVKVACAALFSCVQAEEWMSWHDFKAKHEKVYNGDDEERRSIYMANLDFMAAENAKDHSYTLGVGPFADLTAEEFRTNFFGDERLQSVAPVSSIPQWQGKELPHSLDWSTRGLATPVQDQGQCSLSYAFAAFGALEYGIAISSGEPVALSEQQYVDCSGFSFPCNGGGTVDYAYGFAKDQDICTAATYPYEAQKGSCRTSNCTVGWSGSITGYKGGRSLPDEDVMNILVAQPCAVAIEADQSIFQHYQSGVITGNCSSNVDQAVLLVGYGSVGDDDYWKVKNSWGALWGENGYARMVRGRNQCGINTDVSYPTLSGSSLSV